MPTPLRRRDLVAANTVLGVAVLPVASLVNPPMFPKNNPAICYENPGICGEASLDIQSITQYGEGSGAAFGFAAASNASQFPCCNDGASSCLATRLRGGRPAAHHLCHRAAAGRCRRSACPRAPHAPPPPCLLLHQGFSPNVTNVAYYEGMLGIRPLPDVVSWSWGVLPMDPASGSKPVEGEAVLAKVGGAAACGRCSGPCCQLA